MTNLLQIDVFFFYVAFENENIPLLIASFVDTAPSKCTAVSFAPCSTRYFDISEYPNRKEIILFFRK